MPEMNFTAHNILLDNGEKTRGDKRILLSESAMWKSIEKTTRFLIPLLHQENRKLRVVDLGCLEGGYAVQFDSNIPKTSQQMLEDFVVLQKTGKVPERKKSGRVSFNRD